MNVVIQPIPKTARNPAKLIMIAAMIMLVVSIPLYACWHHNQALQDFFIRLERDESSNRISYGQEDGLFTAHLWIWRDYDDQKAEERLEEWTREYLAGRLNYEQLTKRIEVLEYSGFLPGRINKYRQVARAEELAGQYDLSSAIKVSEAALRLYPDDQLLLSCQASYWNRLQQMAVYQGPVQHIFFHPLVAYPARAFDGDAMSQGFFEYFVTVPEFKHIIEALYRNNYVLISYNDIVDFDPASGRMIKKILRLPSGKKPLILSVDDMNYYPYMIQNGTVSKLTLDKTGHIASLSLDPAGKCIISYDNEIIPILDNFVLQHPDFSYQGTKGIIALTGYQGILGYRTNDPSSPAYREEVKGARTVVNQLKAEGWRFASHGWGHLNTPRLALPKLAADTSRWKAEVEPLTGPSNVYVFPFGARVYPNDPRFKYLQQSGFSIFCAVGSRSYSVYGPDYLLMDRRHMDGIALCTQADMLGDLFDSKLVIDPIRWSGH